jgi:hypothetical protein
VSVPAPASHRWAWIALLALLWLVRVPSLVQPMASDQGLYAYAGQRLMAGDAPYAGAWDQKPPGIHVVYGLLWSVWPDESVVAAADLLAAGLTAWLLVLLGRRRGTEAAGLAAAAILLLLGNPALTQRLGGVFVRAQCETFIALAVTWAMVLAAADDRRRWQLVGIGLLLSAAFWLKYNAAAYALPVLVALACWPAAAANPRQGWLREVGIVAAAGATGVAVPLVLMALSGSLTDLYLATIAYNTAYSGDTYDGLSGVLRYALMFPIERARNDALWFAGGVGLLAGVGAWVASGRDDRRPAATLAVTAGWLAAAWLSILINGGRDLPQYFVQASPALGLAAGLGLMPLIQRAALRHVALGWSLAGLVLYGAHRASGFEQLVAQTRADLSMLLRRTDRATYLADFGGRPQDKFVASSIAALVTHIRATTAPADTIYVFGFSPGVPVLADRRSASRFHWSRPITIEFASDHPGYGSAGLLGELQRAQPALVALQRDSWGAPRGIHSSDVFHSTPMLEGWLTAGYTREADVGRFELWRRN